ncbi:MAG: type II secretion system minor pseudopilin GspJ [bacterium]|nr:type II secretion system protein GspJ [Gammaproteobacteria bacterium]HIL95973.1 type II secretion system protein GspJ [Pseudomonadales bacterium]
MQSGLPRPDRGFTLLEVLVAMSIFAVIGLGSNQMLRTVIQAHKGTQQQIQSFSAYTKAFSMMDRDFSQLIPRPIKDQYGDMSPALVLGSDSYVIEFSRTGWNNPLKLKRSNIQRVAYQLTDENELKRIFWLVLDRAEDSEPIQQTLLTGVEDFRVNLLDAEGDSTDDWGDVENSASLPLGAEVFVTSEIFGEVRKVFSFVEVAVQTDPNQSGQGDTGDGVSDEETLKRIEQKKKPRGRGQETES